MTINYNDYFEKRLKQFVISLILVAIAAMLADIVVQPFIDSIVIINVITILIFCILTVLLVLNKTNYRIAYITGQFSIQVNAIICICIMHHHTHALTAIYGLRDMFLFAMLICIAAVFVGKNFAIATYLLAITYYAMVVYFTTDPFLVGNSFVIILGLTAVLYVLYYFSDFMRKSFEQIQIQSQIIDKSNNELRVINSDLHDSNSIILNKNMQLEELSRSLKQKADELEKSYHEIKSLQAQKDRLYTIIAHDLRNPIYSIEGLSKLLFDNFDKYTKEKSQKFVFNIHKGVQDVHSLLENLLLWSQSHTMQVTCTPVMLSVMEEVASLAKSLDISLAAKHLAFTNNVEGNIFVTFDQNMFNTIIRNFISNAIKFSNDNSEIIVDARKSPHVISIWVTDHGIGMSPAKLQELNENIITQSSRGTMGEKGTGLGLAICKELASRNNARVSITSEPGQGTTITLTIRQ